MSTAELHQRHYNMGPYCKNTSQKSKKLVWYRSLFTYNRPHSYWYIISSQPWSYFQKHKTLQQTTSTHPFLAYTSLVLACLKNTTILQKISPRTGGKKVNWENAIFYPLEASVDFFFHLQLTWSRVLYLNPEPLPKLPNQICEYN